MWLSSALSHFFKRKSSLKKCCFFFALFSLFFFTFFHALSNVCVVDIRMKMLYLFLIKSFCFLPFLLSSPIMLSSERSNCGGESVLLLTEQPRSVFLLGFRSRRSHLKFVFYCRTWVRKLFNWLTYIQETRERCFVLLLTLVRKHNDWRVGALEIKKYS